MKERILKFGPSDELVGVMTDPAAANSVPGAPTAIILNAGIVHHVGPFRLHVRLARRLAEAGFSTLRMDLSGLGDSSLRPGELDPHRRALMDVDEAMNFLSRKRGSDAFVLAGLCSGAFNAHRASVRDDRVKGAIFIDGIAYRTMGFYLRSYLQWAWQPRRIRNAIKRRMKGLVNRGGAPGDVLAEREFFGEGLARDQTQRELANLLDRGVRMLFLYTDGCDDVSHRLQFREMYGFQPDEDQLQVEYHSRAEHTLRLTENRIAVANRIVDWYTHQFGEASTANV